MARFFKKRRWSPGPSKNEKKVMRGQELRSQPSRLQERFPSLQRMTLSLRFLGDQEQVLGEETREFRPMDACDLSAQCRGLCGGAAFDLETKIGEMVEARETLHEFSGKCAAQQLGSPDPCGSELRCRIDLVYLVDAKR